MLYTYVSGITFVRMNHAYDVVTLVNEIFLRWQPSNQDPVFEISNQLVTIQTSQLAKVSHPDALPFKVLSSASVLESLEPCSTMKFTSLVLAAFGAFVAPSTHAHADHDFESFAWGRLAVQLPKPLSDHSASLASDSGLIYIAGGCGTLIDLLRPANWHAFAAATAVLV